MSFKKLYFVLIAVLLVFSACSDDDKEDNKIIGTWTYSFADASASVESNNSKFTAALEEALPPEFASETGYTMTFNEDKTCSVNNESGKWEKGNYVFENGQLTITETSNSEGDTTTYIQTVKATISGDVLTLIFDRKDAYVNSEGEFSPFVDHIFKDYAEQLKDVNKETLKITKADLVLKLKKK